MLSQMLLTSLKLVIIRMMKVCNFQKKTSVILIRENTIKKETEEERQQNYLKNAVEIVYLTQWILKC